jgi:hypothetical protein
MNIQIATSSRRRRDGYVLLLLVLILSGTTVLVLSQNMMRTTTVSMLNMRSDQVNILNNAAEAATEKVYAQMARDFSAYGPGFVSNSLATYSTEVPSATDNPYWTNFTYSDAQGNSGHTYVQMLTNYTGPLPTQYTNQFATTSPIYRLISNVTMPGSTANVVGTAQEDVMLALLPITTYAIFYNGELEFSDCATMTVSGRVHSNADICTGAGSGATLTFNGAVTCCSTISSPGRGGLTYTLNQNTTYNSTYATDVVSMQISIPMTNTHSIIEIPPSGEQATSVTGQQREYNKAQVVMIVTNSPLGGGPQVTVTLQDSYNGNVPGADPTPVTYVVTNCTPANLGTNATLKMASFLSLTNVFGDQRQSQTNMFVTQINIGAYAAWVLTNTAILNKVSASSDNYPTILYVADRRNIGTNRQAVVRLVNAQELPPNTASGANLGFSLATLNPLYVWGNYNTTTDGSHYTLTLGATTNGYTVPAALFCDAITVLSSNWLDSLSNSGYVAREANPANNTVINAAIITGNIPSTGTSATTFSGGVHNLTRLLEDWGSATLTYNTAIVCLFASQTATNQFLMPYSSSNPSGYYTPPTRVWGFDPTYYSINKQPPGVPCALVPIRYNWLSPAPGSLASQ